MKIDVDEAIATIQEWRALNKPELADMQFVRNGEPVVIDPEIVEEFRFIGLNNTDFIRSHFMGEEFYTTLTFEKGKRDA
ncbi:hypothetical protein [Pararobbsia alpina]|uniref:Uncharacterized protein n=1 Tax=Pararobbsia alpina TaxID=621374 RepID=A0A6S7B1F9_9BURK|nr:hypothetical protein [Pararobbsia alpina]CAB3784680.1 hypothetical protein LMG28138_01857 [Pararobbsia alpina]